MAGITGLNAVGVFGLPKPSVNARSIEAEIVGNRDRSNTIVITAISVAYQVFLLNIGFFINLTSPTNVRISSSSHYRMDRLSGSAYMLLSTNILLLVAVRFHGRSKLWQKIQLNLPDLCCHCFQVNLVAFI
jgi:hypothetical protein